MRLGEALVQAGLLSRTNLSKALERQVIMGERLGTSLMELGYISEADLVNSLSKLYKVPMAPFSAFINLSSEVIKLIPEALASKYHIIPLKKERNQIHLAMADPSNLPAIDELKFILGAMIIPYVASEIRVQMALEKYYGVVREQRYVSLTTLLEERSPLRRPAAATVEETPFLSEPEEAAARPEALTPLEAASRELVNINGRDELGNIILRFAEKKLKRVVLFIIRGDKAFGWKGAGREILLDSLPKIEVDLRLPSFLNEAAERKNFFTGTLLPLPGNDALLRQLGPARPQEIIAFPITIKGKAVMVLYGDDGDKSLLMGDHEELKQLALKASMALEILILRNKILEMG